MKMENKLALIAAVIMICLSNTNYTVTDDTIVYNSTPFDDISYYIGRGFGEPYIWSFDDYLTLNPDKMTIVDFQVKKRVPGKVITKGHGIVGHVTILPDTILESNKITKNDIEKNKVFSVIFQNNKLKIVPGDAGEAAKIELKKARDYQNGTNGVSKDYVFATRSYKKVISNKKALKKDIADAQLGLADIYFYGGFGVTKDYPKAKKYYSDVKKNEYSTNAAVSTAKSQIRKIESIKEENIKPFHPVHKLI